MKLYYSPGACSMAPHLVIQELGLPCTLIKVDLGSKKMTSGSFYSVNPKGQVPTLELDNGQILTEGAVILQYLADQVPEKNLIPRAGTWERYRCQEWLNYVATELHKNFTPLWDKRVQEEAKEIFKSNLAKKFDFLNEKLNSQAYLMGTSYSVADSYLYTVLTWAAYVNIDMTKWPKLMGYMEKIKNRPATITVLQAEKSSH